MKTAAARKSHQDGPITRSVDLSPEAIAELLDKLDATPGTDKRSNRRFERRPYRTHGVQLSFMDSSGNVVRSVRVITRNISPHGIAILHKHMIALGQEVVLELPLSEERCFRIRGRVKQCRYIGRMVHEVGIEFTQFMD